MQRENENCYRVASEIWSDSLKEYFCVEPSEFMIELAERLAETADPKIKNIFYRQFFPASINVRTIYNKNNYTKFFKIKCI